MSERTMERILEPTAQVIVSAALIVLLSAIGGKIATKGCTDDGSLTYLGVWVSGAIWGYLLGLMVGILVLGKLLSEKTPLWLSVGMLGIGIAVILITSAIHYELIWAVVYLALVPPAIIVLGFHLLRYSFRQLRALLGGR